MRRPRRSSVPSDLPRARVCAALERLGFVLKREGAKHSVYAAPDRPDALLVLPRHSRIKRQLLRGILRQVDVSEAEFMAHY